MTDLGEQMDHTTSKYLVLDSRAIERTENLRLTLGDVHKAASAPFFVEDRPWEVRFDNLYPNVLYDPGDALLKCWYNTFVIDEATANTSQEERKQVRYRPQKREMGICYAVSKHGLTWQKPDLGLIDFQGSRHNNLVMRNVHGVGIRRDWHDPDPARRYKAFDRQGVATSPDGLRWSEVHPCPEIEAAGDTHNNAFWDERSGRYVGITRLWDGSQRIVGRTESADFRHWTKAVEVLRALPEETERQIYALLAFPYAGLYLGLIMLINQCDDTVDCELVWSADTVQWNRVCAGSPLVPRGEPGGFDCGCLYAAADPISWKDGVRLYYGGSDGPHGGWRAGGFGMATLPCDGFARLEPMDARRSGTLVTAPVQWAGSELRINADATAGQVRVSVLNAPDLSIAECLPMTGDVVDGCVTWRASNTASLRGQTVQFRFELDQARLYTFGFAD